MISTSPSTIAHFTYIATQTIQELTDSGILRLMVGTDSVEPLDLHSEFGQDLIAKITTSIYEGVIKDMNTHLAINLDPQ